MKLRPGQPWIFTDATWLMRRYVSFQRRQLSAIATGCYAKLGRGYVLLIVKGDGVRSRDGAITYITRAQEHDNAIREPQSRDARLEQMIDTYDPESQAIILAWYVHRYKVFTVTTSAFKTNVN